MLTAVRLYASRVVIAFLVICMTYCSLLEEEGHYIVLRVSPSTIYSTRHIVDNGAGWWKNQQATNLLLLQFALVLPCNLALWLLVTVHPVLLEIQNTLDFSQKTQPSPFRDHHPE